MGTQLAELQDLLLHEVQDLYDAEKRLTEALPKMADAATSSDLSDAFHHHLDETRQQVKRLEQVFEILGKPPKRETCAAMKGLISEGEDMIKAKGDDAVRDAGLIAAAQRVEHYEIAGYGTVRSLAQRLGLDDAAQLLQTTLDEEKNADETLTAIAEQSVNANAEAEENPNGSLDEQSKNELYEKAAELQIEGRSKMSKQELVKAISSKE